MSLSACSLFLHDLFVPCRNGDENISQGSLKLLVLFLDSTLTSKRGVHLNLLINTRELSNMMN